LLRNQNNLLPLKSGAKLVVTGPSAGLDDQPARWLERELAGRLRRRARLLHGSGGPDPAGSTVLTGLRAADPNRDLRADRPPGGRPARRTPCSRGRREGLRGSLGDNPAPALAADQKALISRAAGDRKAGHRGGHGRPPRSVSARPQNAAGLLMAYQGSTEARRGRRPTCCSAGSTPAAGSR